MINNRIAEIRKKMRLSEKQLAEKIGMTVTGFRQAMSKNEFKSSTLITISKVLEVTVSYLFGEQPNNETSIELRKRSKEKIEYQNKLDIAETKIIGLEEQLKLQNKIISLLELQKH